MGKKSRFKKIKNKKFKPNNKSYLNNSNKVYSKSEIQAKSNLIQKNKNKTLIDKRKGRKKKLKKISNKNIFNVEHEIMDEIDEILWNQEDIEGLPHDKFTQYLIPSTPEENKKYLPLLISDSDIILELLDSRDIIHSRNKQFEESFKNKKNKLLIYILTKSDLVSAEYLLRAKNILQKEDDNSIIISISSLIRETIQSFLIEIKKYTETFKKNIKTNKLIKVGILGAPNIGKNSFIQSLELIFHANCDDKYIFFDDEKTFCINSVPAVLYDELEENNVLISKIYKNIKEIPEPKHLLQNLMSIINNNILKDTYELSKVPENLDDFIYLIEQKYEFKEYNGSIWKIIEDIITGKIKYEISLDFD